MPQLRFFHKKIPSARTGEWISLETAEDSRCGLEVFIKYEGLNGKICPSSCDGSHGNEVATKGSGEVVVGPRTILNRTASVNRRRSAYVLPFELVDKFEVFPLRSMSMPVRTYGPEPGEGNGADTQHTQHTQNKRGVS